MNLLILGADTLTGLALTGLAANESLAHHAMGTSEFLGLTKSDLTKALTRVNPSLVIYLATFSGVELAETDPEAARQCDKVNSAGVSAVAELCAKLQVPLIFHSNSFVFDGTKAHPYQETDQVNPRNRYGISKLAGERAVRELLPSHIILRTDWVFGREHPQYFEQILAAFRKGKGQIKVVAHRFSPTPGRDVARVLMAIAKQVDCATSVWGTYHYCALQPMSQEFFAEHVIQEAARYDKEIADLLPNLEIIKLPVTPPWILNSVLSTQHLFETFGIKQRPRGAELTAVVQKICNFVAPEEPPASNILLDEDVDSNTPEVMAEINRTRSSGTRRRLRKKPGSAKPAKKAGKQTK